MICPVCRASTSDSQPFCAACGARQQPATPASEVSDASTHLESRPPSEALETGTTFAGRYQIIEELGRGGMGRVYKVIDQEVHAKIALKLIRPDIAADQATIDRFRQRADDSPARSPTRTSAGCTTSGADGTTYFLTMEYVSGRT